jgi:hypothetical protein
LSGGRRVQRESIYLDPAIFCELNTMIRNKLVDLAVLVAFALGVADEDDHLHGSVNGVQRFTSVITHARFAHGGCWYLGIA